jgi:predicted phosphodiesterase
MSLRVLQFSDIHFSSRSAGQRIEHDDVREQLLADLTQLNRPPVDLILIAGDIAYSGKRNEYQRAAQWLERARIASSCPLGRVLSVPGNHDVDRNRITTSTKLIHRSLRTAGLPQAEDELLSIATAGDPSLLDKLAEYQTFAASYGCFFESPSLPRWERSFSLAPYRTLTLTGLTTVQVCDDEDAKDAMLLGKHQYIIPRTPGVERVVIMHHSLEWLKDRQPATNYLASRARILIVGHEHVQNLQKTITPNGDERLLIASGALTGEGNEPYVYRYNIIDLDSLPEAPTPCLSVTIFPRIWSREKTAFRPDYESTDQDASVTVSLLCPQYGAPRAADAASSLATPATNENIARLRHIFWGRLEWQDRMRALISADSLPDLPPAPLPQSLEESALRGAEENGNLHGIWKAIMALLPAGERQPNPFDPPAK